MDEIYRGFRITLKSDGDWTCRITRVRGSLAPFSAIATEAEGPQACSRRARRLIDEYLDFLGPDGDGDLRD